MARFHVFSLRGAKSRAFLIFKVFLILVLLGLILPRVLAFINHQLLPTLAPLWGSIVAPKAPAASVGEPAKGAPTAATTPPVTAAKPSPAATPSTPAAPSQAAGTSTVKPSTPAAAGSKAAPTATTAPTARTGGNMPFLTVWFRSFVAALQAFYQGAK